MDSPLGNLPENVEKELRKRWKTLKDEEKEYFVNQLALFLSIVGADKEGKDILAIIIEKLVRDKAKLTEMPKHLKWFIENGGLEIYKKKENKIKKALHLLEVYSIDSKLA